MNTEISSSENRPTSSVADKPPYVPPSDFMTQKGPEGIRFDFNNGARIALPKRKSGTWRVTLRDNQTDNILFRSEVPQGIVMSSKKYFINFSFQIEAIEDDQSSRLVFEHVLNLKGKNVVVQLPVGTLGDTLGWFPYVVRFADQHKAKLTCILSPVFIPLFEKNYPHIIFKDIETAKAENLLEKTYANYCIGLFFNDTDFIKQPTDFRMVGLHRTAGYILGVDHSEQRPDIFLEDTTRPIDEPYVCIAVQASTQCKYWNNPYGWRDVVSFLKEHGYRVFCIDKEPIFGSGLTWNYMPHGAEDQTGSLPLAERARWLKHASFFIGGSSGLAWLAWAMNTKVLMISGFTHPLNEFETPYRVINWHTCNSCWNDPTVQFDHKDFLWCPRHAGTARQFECTRLISSQQVIKTIEKIMSETP